MISSGRCFLALAKGKTFDFRANFDLFAECFTPDLARKVFSRKIHAFGP